MLRTPTEANSLYLLSISDIAHLRAERTLSTSTITGVRRWGTPLYKDSSTRLGSTKMRLSSEGELRKKGEARNAWMDQDLPDPVDPAIKTWRILAMSAPSACPETFNPSATVSLLLLFCTLSDSRIRRTVTNSGLRLGISMPTSDLPGIGASILICPGAARARARSFWSVVIFDNFVPRAISKAYCVTAGPWFTSATRAVRPNDSNVFSIIAAFCLMSPLSALPPAVSARIESDGYSQISVSLPSF